MPTLITNQELDKMEAKNQEAFSKAQRPVIDQISAYVEKCWQDADRAKKQYIEPRLLESMRRRRAEYDPAKLSAIKKLGSALTFLPHTGLKCRAAKSWIQEVIIPSGDKPWGLDPTPIPDLPPDVEIQLQARMNRDVVELVQQTGVIPDPADVSQAIDEKKTILQMERRQEAESRAKKMEVLIDDQFIEGKLSKALDEFIDDLTTFPSAVLRGPMVVRDKVLEWDGNNVAVANKIITKNKRVSPFDIFPSPKSSGPDDGYLIERMNLTRSELLEFRGTPGVSDESLALVLQEYANKGSDIRWQQTERLQLENKDPIGSSSGTSDDQIETLEFWGSVPGSMLIEWGMKQPLEPQLEYEINAIKAGNRIIKAVLNPDPLGRRPYFVTSYEKVPGAFWGMSIPEIMAPVQDAINACIRAILDNIGLASGPQVLLDLNRIHPAQRGTAGKIWPRKVWFARSSPIGGSGGMPIEFNQPKIVVDSLLRVLNKLEQLADDYTGIPAYTYGNENVGGAGETASGLSMLMNAASKGIRQVIGNIGMDVMSPRVERQYNHNMLYHPDRDVKGDVKVNARGTMAEIMKDQQNNDRMNFIQSFIDPQMVMELLDREGVLKLLRTTTDRLDIPGLFKDNLDMGPGAPLPENVIPGLPEAEQAALGEPQASPVGVQV